MIDTHEYTRKPTEFEMLIGEGALHYVILPDCYCCDDNGLPKQWVTDPTTGLRCTLVK